MKMYGGIPRLTALITASSIIIGKYICAFVEYDDSSTISSFISCCNTVYSLTGIMLFNSSTKLNWLMCQAVPIPNWNDGSTTYEQGLIFVCVDNDDSGSQRSEYRGGYRGRNNRGRSRGRGRGGGNWRGGRGGGYRGRGRSQSHNAGPRSYLDDDDESMDDDNVGGKSHSSRL